MDVLNQLRRQLTRPYVRPWALSAPILVLLICLPMLRPLRHPDPRLISNDELARLATVQALVEQRSLAIDSSHFVPTDHTFHRGGATYSRQPPVLALLLAGAYWVMTRLGLTFANNPSLVQYLLTLLGSAIPVAFAAGLIYRMGRMFELHRIQRAGLAAAVVLGSGLVSYGTVLNSQAPAAALLLAAAACLVHVAISKRPSVTIGWLAIAGICAALAAVIEPAAVIFSLLLMAVIPAMRWRLTLRVGGLLLYLLGLTPPLLLHAMLMQPITGAGIGAGISASISAGMGAGIGAGAAIRPALAGPVIGSTEPAALEESDDLTATGSTWDAIGRNLERVTGALFGAHGLLSHFPVMLFGLLGVGAVMHRHWPATTKVLATVTLIGALVVIVLHSLITVARARAGAGTGAGAGAGAGAGTGAMFGPQAFILFLPLVLFWSGAWLRRRHHPAAWAIAGCCLLFSAAVALIGATDPCPRDGYDRYSAAQALANLIHPESIETPPDPGESVKVR